MLIPTLPTTPGAIIGYTRRGPIRLLAGGSGEGDGGGDNGGQDGDGQQAGQDGTQPAAKPAENGDGKDSGRDGDVGSLPDWAQKLVKDLRSEAASNRTTAKQTAAEEARNEFAQKIGKALGLIKDGEKAPDADQLARDLAAAQKDGQQARVELAVYRAAGKAGADADALLDSRAFLDSLKDVDPTDAKKVGALIKTALDDNPRYRASGQAPAPRGGTEPTGRPGKTGKPATLDAAIAAKMRG